MNKRSPNRILVTGGAGFIGSALIRYLIRETECEVINLDKLTYAGNLESLTEVVANPRYNFEQVDICDWNSLNRLFQSWRPDTVMHLAAESHVDRSIDGAGQFIKSNIVGTYSILESSLRYWRKLTEETKAGFIFCHISTDEVYGSLGPEGLFSENTAYDPNSPYSASKASADHLVRAWYRTYGLPTIVTNCSNNYGSYQFPEKLIPLVILNAIEGKRLPIYGKGDNVRDWLYVEDHVRALYKVITEGRTGETYNIGGHNEKSNIEVVREICAILDEVHQNRPAGISKHEELIEYVTDRPGHDKRYAIDASKIENELGWKPKETFESGLKKTVRWYLENRNWWSNVLDGSYCRERLGLGVEEVI